MIDVLIGLFFGEVCGWIVGGLAITLGVEWLLIGLSHLCKSLPYITGIAKVRDEVEPRLGYNID